MNCEASAIPTFSMRARLSLKERISKLMRLSLFGFSGSCIEPVVFKSRYSNLLQFKLRREHRFYNYCTCDLGYLMSKTIAWIVFTFMISSSRTDLISRSSKLQIYPDVWMGSYAPKWQKIKIPGLTTKKQSTFKEQGTTFWTETNSKWMSHISLRGTTK